MEKRILRQIEKTVLCRQRERRIESLKQTRKRLFLFTLRNATVSAFRVPHKKVRCSKCLLTAFKTSQLFDSN